MSRSCLAPFRANGNRGFEMRDALVELASRNHVRWQQPDHGVRRAVDEQSTLECGFHDRRRRTVKIDTPDQPRAANLADRREPRRHRTKRVTGMATDFSDVLHEAVLRQLLEEDQ